MAVRTPHLYEVWTMEPERAEDTRSLHETDAAIHEREAAYLDDGKDLNDRFPIDGHLTPQKRFAKANELLYAAHQDLPHAEDVPQSQGLRNRALMHVDQAHNTVDQAVKIARWQ